MGCTSCGQEVQADSSAVEAGTRVVVWKAVTTPQRWDQVVFEYPPNRARTYVSRVVGLPGETIEVFQGNLFVDSEVATKSDDVQRALWIPFHDSRQVHPFLPRWAAEPPGGWDVSAGELLQTGADPESWLVFQGELGNWLP